MMASFCTKSSKLALTFVELSRSVILPSASVMNKRYISNNTIDTADLNHLSKFAAEWWDPQGQMKLLHALNIIRVPFVRDSLVTMTPDTPQSTCLRGKKILEVGCGAGIMAEDLAKCGADVVGIDPCKELLQVAIEHAKFNKSLTNKPTYIYAAIEDHIKDHSNEYDAVVASEVIEHINTSQRENFIESCVKALKPGGKIIFTTPNRTRMSQLLGIWFVELFHIMPKGIHHYHKFSTQEELKYWLELNDCRVDLVQGYVYYFWRHEWKWIKWQGLMYAMRAVKLNKID